MVGFLRLGHNLGLDIQPTMMFFFLISDPCLNIPENFED